MQDTTHAIPEVAKPTVVAIDMGYGHLRPARAIATMLGCPVLHADQPPLADTEEQKRWASPGVSTKRCPGFQKRPG
jgi:hypothetical protein